VEQAGGSVVLLDGGDLVTGTFCSDELRAEPDVEGYRLLGYGAMALGNHEFDLPFEALQRLAAQAHFPWLGANVLFRSDGRPAFGDVATWNIGGIRVAAIGLSPADTPLMSTRGNDPRFVFQDPAAVAKARLPALRQSSRVLIGLFHLPLDEIERVIQSAPGIDLVVSGHDHVALHTARRIADTVVVQAGAEGRFLGRVDMEVPAEGRPRILGSSLVPVGPDVPEDPDVVAALAAKRKRCSGSMRVGTLLVAARRDAFVDGPGTPPLLANLVTDALREAAAADVAFVNRGGMRTDLPAGDITREKVHDVLPFADTLTVFEVSGADVGRLVDEMSRRKPGGPGTLYPSGIEILFEGPGRARVRRNGKPLRPDEKLTLVVSTFLASGGDGYKSFATFRRIREIPMSPEAALEAYLRRHTPARPACEARVRWRGMRDPHAVRPCRLQGGEVHVP